MDAGVLVRFTLVEGGFRSKNADLYLRRIPAGRACVACDFLLPLLRFLRRKAKRDPAVAPFTDAFKGVRVVAADMNWQMRFLQRFRIRFYGRVVDELAAVLGFILRPYFLHCEYPILDLRPPAGVVGSHQNHFLLEPASSDTKQEPAAGEHIPTRPFLPRHHPRASRHAPNGCRRPYPARGGSGQGQGEERSVGT